MRQNLPRERRNQMGTNYAKKGERRSAPHRGTPAPSHRPAVPLSPIGMAHSRPGTSRKERAVNFGKILNNSIKLDKFTGFFDKFLKIIFSVNGCNSNVYCKNMSGEHSSLATKKSFSPPTHLPATARKSITGQSSKAGPPSRAAPRRRRRCPLPRSPAHRPSARPGTRCW